MKVWICELRDDISDHESVGVGKTRESAVEDALRHFVEKPYSTIYNRLSRGNAHAEMTERELK